MHRQVDIFIHFPRSLRYTAYNRFVVRVCSSTAEHNVPPNDEAKLSRGAIYYYKDFVELAKEKIQEHKNDVKVEKSPATKEEKLRNQRDNEKRLKKDYYEQVSTLNGLNDAMVAENAVLAYRCMVLEDEINALTNGKISFIK